MSANKGVFELERELTLVDKFWKTDQIFLKFQFSGRKLGRFREDSPALVRSLDEFSRNRFESRPEINKKIYFVPSPFFG